MKLIIDIPEEDYEFTKSAKTARYFSSAYYVELILNGIPLDDVKAEIEAMFPPSGNWMYDEECEHEHTVCEVLADVLQILDNIGNAESQKLTDDVGFLNQSLEDAIDCS